MEVSSGAVPGTRNIGSNRELFVDDALVEKMMGKAVLHLHHPERREIALVHDAPWEGNGCGYHTVFRDGAKYRMYYKAWQISAEGDVSNPVVICYAESHDGIQWVKPELGLVMFNGSVKNNIILDNVNGYGCHDFSPFIDTRPGVTLKQRYKAIGYVRGHAAPHGLMGFISVDGIHWQPVQDDCIITEEGWVFDTQNIAFWSGTEEKYIMYYRKTVDGVRNIARAVSDDFIHWTKEGVLDFKNRAPNQSEQFYTNQIRPYYRAPNVYIGFPSRYCDRGWIHATDALPSPDLRRKRAKGQLRYGSAVTDALLIASRDGHSFYRWDDAFIRPGLRTLHNWAYGDNYIAWHVVETQPTSDDQPNELSLYATESYFTGNSCRLRRYALRLDGFASIYAPADEGEVVTRPFIFKGNTLRLNFSTSAAGSILVEIQNAAGAAEPGFKLADCQQIFGDALDFPVEWTENSDLNSLEGQAVRLRFVLREADVFAFRFAE
ncbi:hypothetical protein JXJ21_25430 [candidate division KSB1 bacterium]|nr:hypothetical protein [candidate division KSB1 bacterium]